MKKITIKEVAEEAGVSKTTISRYLNQNYGNMSVETKKKIGEVIARLNYRPNKQAQSLKSNRSYLIGVVVADISNMYSSLLLKGIGSVIKQSGYQMIIIDAGNSINQEKELLEKLLDQNVEGIILQPSARDSADYEFIAQRKVPLLLVDRQTEPPKWSSITTNNTMATQEVIEVAIKKGYEKITVITEPILETSTRELRFNAVKNKVEKHGKMYELCEVTSEDQIEKLLESILTYTDKTLLFASNGRILMDVLRVLIKQKISIPETVGVTGFDDWHLTELVGPGITSIEQPSKEIGKMAGEYLLEMLREEKERQDVVVPSVISWRHSV